MGVITCDRNNCENIMSEYYSHEHGNLCWECYNELSENKQGFVSISQFMRSPKVYISDEFKLDLSTFKSRWEQQ